MGFTEHGAAVLGTAHGAVRPELNAGNLCSSYADTFEEVTEFFWNPPTPLNWGVRPVTAEGKLFTLAALASPVIRSAINHRSEECKHPSLALS